jgi:hypothetical protein
METTSEDKQILSRKILRIFIRPGYGMYLFIRRYIAVSYHKFVSGLGFIFLWCAQAPKGDFDEESVNNQIAKSPQV